MSESIEVLKYFTYFIWFGLLFMTCYYWCKGLFDGRSMFKIVGIILGISIGYMFFHSFFKLSYSENYGNVFQCRTGSNGVYIDCAGWPIFSKSIAFIAEKVVSFINGLYAFSIGYVQIITAMYIFTRFSKGIYSGEMKEIFFAFAGGAILYVSLVYMADISASFMNLTQYLLGFSADSRPMFGKDGNTVTNVIANLKEWHRKLEDLTDITKDGSVLSFQAVINLLKLLVVYIFWIFVKIPLIWFSILNIVLLVFQQFLLISIPVDAIKMSISLNIDPFLIIKKLFAMSLLSMAVVSEYYFLSWIPSADSILPPVTSAGLSFGLYFFGMSTFAVIILVMITLSLIFSGIAIFKAFHAGKTAYEGMR